MFDFKRTHIATENEYYGTFNASHDSVFADRKAHDPLILNAKANQLLAKWHSQSSTYKYELLHNFGCN